MAKTSLSKPPTPTTLPRKPPESRRAEAEEVQTVPPPQTPADIPGLGPIRVRALEKAGFGSLAALRAASLEDLLTVPGLSEIKARHIQAFLARFPAAPEGKPKRARAETKTTPAPVREKPVRTASGPKRAAAEPTPPVASEPSPAPLSTLTENAAAVLKQLAALLHSDQTDGLRPRLKRELAELTTTVQALQAQGSRLSEKARERAARRLVRIGEELAAADHPDFDRKAQAELAESLAKANAKLALPD